MKLIEKIMGFRETESKRFEYRFEPYLIIIISGLGLWILLGLIAGALDYSRDWVVAERLIWWFAFIWVMFYMDRRNSKMALAHNLQQIDIRFNEMHNLRVFKSLTNELIKEKIKCQTKKPAPKKKSQK